DLRLEVIDVGVTDPGLDEILAEVDGRATSEEERGRQTEAREGALAGHPRSRAYTRCTCESRARAGNVVRWPHNRARMEEAGGRNVIAPPRRLRSRRRDNRARRRPRCCR